MWMRSAAGTVIEFYNYIDPAYVYEPMYEVENLHLTQGYFHSLARSDRTFFKKWEDFTLYDTNSFHRFVEGLLKAGFQIMLDPDAYWEANLRESENIHSRDYLPDQYNVCEKVRGPQKEGSKRKTRNETGTGLST
jgi:hypothetical protein